MTLSSFIPEESRHAFAQRAVSSAQPRTLYIAYAELLIRAADSLLVGKPLRARIEDGFGEQFPLLLTKDRRGAHTRDPFPHRPQLITLRYRRYNLCSWAMIQRRLPRRAT